MSLSVDGVWKAGVWAITVWADGVWAEGGMPPVVITATESLGANRWLRSKKPKKVRFSDYANREDYAIALAQALAEASIPIHASSVEEDEDELDDEAIIEALTVVMTNVRSFD